MQRTLFHERQSGDLCRVHALNALFGRVVIDELRLKEWARKFDDHYGYHVTDQFDCVQSDSLTLVSFILETQCKYVTHYVPFNSQAPIAALLDVHVPALLMFNAHHIWTLRRWEEGDGHWYNLDSLMGRPLRLPHGPPVTCPPHTGAILILTRNAAKTTLLPLYQAQVCKQLRAQNLSSSDAVRTWAAQVQARRELGALETSLCNLFRVYSAMTDADTNIVHTYKVTLQSLAPSLTTIVWTQIVPLLQFVVKHKL